MTHGVGNIKIRHDCLPMRMEKLGSHWTYADNILCQIFFRKPIEKTRVSLKSERITRTLYKDYVHLW
jgi:hypothetical protein